LCFGLIIILVDRLALSLKDVAVTLTAPVLNAQLEHTDQLLALTKKPLVWLVGLALLAPTRRTVVEVRLERVWVH
jgi:hypothetical protein